MTFDSYLDLLDTVHRHLLPNCYLEIGVRTGGSATLALPGTKAILIDPQPKIRFSLPEHSYIEAVTSDEFFETRATAVGLSPGDIDLSYIDGLHVFDFALRDYFNVEKFCHAESLVLLDDCIPPNEIASRPNRETVLWAGDVWKVLAVLEEIDPSIEITLIDIEPAGLAALRRVRPDRGLSSVEISEIVARFNALDFERDFVQGVLARAKREGRLVPPTESAVASILPDRRRPESPEQLVAMRSSRATPPIRTLLDATQQTYRFLPDGLRHKLSRATRPRF